MRELYLKNPQRLIIKTITAGNVVTLSKPIIERFLINNGLTSEQIDNFFKEEIPLSHLGFCNGILMELDTQLQTIHESLAILSSDTWSKYVSDVRREFCKQL